MLRFSFFISVIVAATVAFGGTCPDSPTSATRALVTGNFDPGSLLTATLVHQVSAHRQWYGPKVVARIDYELVCNGQTILPKGSEVIGRIEQGNLLDDRHPTSSVRFQFGQLKLRGLESVYFTGSVAAIASAKAAPLDVSGTGISGLNDLRLEDDGSITSFVMRNTTIPEGAQLLIQIVDSGETEPGCLAGASGLLPGMHLSVNLERAIAALDAKPGEKVAGTTARALRCFGRTIIPHGARVIGRVSEISGAGPQQILGIVFDRIRFSRGQRVNIEGRVQAFGREPTGNGEYVFECHAEYSQPYCSPSLAADPQPCGAPVYQGQSCSTSSYTTYRYPGANSHGFIVDDRYSLDEEKSAISSSTQPVRLERGERLIVNVVAVK